MAGRGSRPIVHAGHGLLDTKIYSLADLLAGNVIHGPAVIEEQSSTTVLEPGDKVTVDKYGHLIMEWDVTG